MILGVLSAWGEFWGDAAGSGQGWLCRDGRQRGQLNMAPGRAGISVAMGIMDCAIIEWFGLERTVKGHVVHPHAVRRDTFHQPRFLRGVCSPIATIQCSLAKSKSLSQSI